MTQTLVGIADLSERWNYSRQGVHRLTKLDDFPPPIAVINCGRTKVWQLNDLAQFEENHPELHSEEAKRQKGIGYYRARLKGQQNGG